MQMASLAAPPSPFSPFFPRTGDRAVVHDLSAHGVLGSVTVLTAETGEDSGMCVTASEDCKAGAIVMRVPLRLAVTPRAFVRLLARGEDDASASGPSSASASITTSTTPSGAGVSSITVSDASAAAAADTASPESPSSPASPASPAPPLSLLAELKERFPSAMANDIDLKLLALLHACSEAAAPAWQAYADTLPTTFSHMPLEWDRERVARLGPLLAPTLTNFIGTMKAEVEASVASLLPVVAFLGGRLPALFPASCVATLRDTRWCAWAYCAMTSRTFRLGPEAALPALGGGGDASEEASGLVSSKC